WEGGGFSAGRRGGGGRTEGRPPPQPPQSAQRSKKYVFSAPSLFSGVAFPSPLREACASSSLLPPRLTDPPGLQDLPLRIVLRAPVLAAAVKEVAAGLLGQRMDQQHALHAAGHDDPLHRLEVLARLLVVPRGAALRQRLQPERRAGTVARDAAPMARTLGDEDRLHLRPDPAVA